MEDENNNLKGIDLKDFDYTITHIGNGIFKVTMKNGDSIIIETGGKGCGR